jgi:hypothetical protein
MLKPAHRGPKRTGPSRKDQVVELLRRENGVTIEQLVGMFNWEPHTARAAISVASKWLGIKVERDESTRAYRLPSPPPEA